MSTNENTETSARALICCFCDKSWSYDGISPKEPLLKEAFEHEAICEKNPYLLRIRELERELALVRNDIILAAGELLIPAPEPGSNMSRMLVANRILCNERDEVTKHCDVLAEALKEIASGAYCWKTCVDVIAPKALEPTKGGGD